MFDLGCMMLDFLHSNKILPQTLYLNSNYAII